MSAELTRLAGAGGPHGRDARTALDATAAGQDRLRAAIRALTAARGTGSSICPSDAARAVGGPGWRDLMPAARDAARDLAAAGEVQLTQRGVVLDPAGEWRGPIRIRRPR